MKEASAASAAAEERFTSVVRTIANPIIDGVPAGGEDLFAELEPPRGRDGVDGGIVDGDGGDAVRTLVDADTHGAPFALDRRPRQSVRD